MYVPTTIYFVTILLDVTEKLKSVNKSLHTSRRSIFCAQTSSTRKSPSRESSSSWTLPQLLCFLCRCLILLRHGSYRRKWSHRQLRQELPVPRGRGSPSPTFVSRAELATGGLEPYCFLVFSRAPWFPPTHLFNHRSPFAEGGGLVDLCGCHLCHAVAIVLLFSLFDSSLFFSVLFLLSAISSPSASTSIGSMTVTLSAADAGVADVCDCHRGQSIPSCNY